MSKNRCGIVVVSTMVLAVLAAGPAALAYPQNDTLVPSPIYQTAPGEPLIYLNGIMARNTGFVATGGRVLANPGGPFVVDSFFDIYTEVSTDGGTSWESFDVPGVQLHILYTPQPPAPVQIYDTEILSMDIMGGDFPPYVMIRESPSLPSAGRTTIEDVGGGYAVESFFDVFTELSIDAGQTWVPSQTSMHITGSPEPATLSLLAIGGALLAWRRRK